MLIPTVPQRDLELEIQRRDRSVWQRLVQRSRTVARLRNLAGDGGGIATRRVRGRLNALMFPLRSIASPEQHRKNQSGPLLPETKKPAISLRKRAFNGGRGKD
ncbi:MAG: hypothetical protein ABI240_04285 [Sphingomonas sp.]